MRCIFSLHIKKILALYYETLKLILIAWLANNLSFVSRITIGISILKYQNHKSFC